MAAYSALSQLPYSTKNVNTAELAQSLKKSKELAPVYIIHGPESFTRTEAIRIIRAMAEKQNADIAEPEPDRLEATALIDDLRTSSLFASSRLVIVDGADKFIANSAEQLRTYAVKPNHSVTLVLAAEKTDARGKAVKALLKACAIVECPALRAWDIPAWCVQRAKLHGKRLDTGAAKLMVELAGTNLGSLDGQIQALAAYRHDQAKITSKDVMNFVGGDHARTVWELAHAVTARQGTEALKALDRLLREPRVTASWIVASLSRESRDIWRTRVLLDEGCSASEIEKALGKPNWLVKRLIQAARRADAKTLQSNYQLLLKADRDSKTGVARDEWILESLIIRLCEPSQHTAPA